MTDTKDSNSFKSSKPGRHVTSLGTRSCNNITAPCQQWTSCCSSLFPQAPMLTLPWCFTVCTSRPVTTQTAGLICTRCCCSCFTPCILTSCCCTKACSLFVVKHMSESGSVNGITSRQTYCWWCKAVLSNFPRCTKGWNRGCLLNQHPILSPISPVT